MAAVSAQSPPAPSSELEPHTISTSPVATTKSTPITPTSAFARWTPSLPTSLMGMLNPFASTPEPKQDPPTPMSSIPFPKGPPSPSRSSASVMFAEPDSRSISDLDSREGSIYDLKRSRKSSKPKTSYSICHPPPASAARQKLHRRPRSLLQLHKVTHTSRPVPAFDVIPSANFSVKIQRTVTKLFKGKHTLCPNDLVVLAAEKYSTVTDDDDDEEGRHVIGLICKGKKEDRDMGKQKVFLASGLEWEACPLPSGAYEFVTIDEHGLRLTVRWVPKKAKEGSKARNHKQFNFSTISPNSRRHPVIATLTRSALDINDHYRMPDQNFGTPTTSPQKSSIIAEALAEEASQENLQEHRETDDALKELAIMTSIWVTFKEGWSPTFRSFEDKDALKNSIITSSPAIQGSTDTPPGSPALLAQDRRTNSVKSISTNLFRKGSRRSKDYRSSLQSVPSVAEEVAEMTPLASPTSGRARADSSSTVVIHRAASTRRKDKTSHLSIQQTVGEATGEDGGTGQFVKRASWQESSLSSPTSPRKDKIHDSPTGPVNDEDPSKRGSTATEKSSSSGTRSTKPAKSTTVNSESSKRKNGKWRRILCGKRGA